MSNKDAHIRFRDAIEYVKSKGLAHKQQDIADAIQMSKSAISESIKGTNGRPSVEILKKFCAAYPIISPAWLISGEGEMAIPSPDDIRLDALTSQNAALLAENAALRSEIDGLRAELRELRAELASLHTLSPSVAAEPAIPLVAALPSPDNPDTPA